MEGHFCRFAFWSGEFIILASRVRWLVSDEDPAICMHMCSAAVYIYVLLSSFRGGEKAALFSTPQPGNGCPRHRKYEDENRLRVYLF
jgi:hypothetical protein